MCSLCRTQSDRWRRSRDRWVGVGERELAAMRAWDPEGTRLRLSGHMRQRLFDRAIPERTVRDVVLRDGTLLFRAWSPEEGTVLRLLGAAENGRPLHVVVALTCDRGGPSWRVITVKRPDTRPWQWAEGFSRRVCFCAAVGWED